jgi:hypothetical protein
MGDGESQEPRNLYTRTRRRQPKSSLRVRRASADLQRKVGGTSRMPLDFAFTEEQELFRRTLTETAVADFG